MPNDFQRVMDSLLNGILFTICYIDDILVATKGTVGEQKAIVQTMLETLDKKTQQLKAGVKPLIKKADAIKTSQFRSTSPQVHFSVRSISTINSFRTFLS